MTEAHSPVPRRSLRRSRRIALAFAAVALVLAVGGALSFRRFVTLTKDDPGLMYRDRATFEKLLERARHAEARGDSGTAITTYRFILAVGAKGDSTLEPHVTIARARLERLRAASSDTPPGPPR
jgi:hypothetical protein